MMNAANSKRIDRLLRDIELHNLQFRRFGSILLVDAAFLRFYDTIDAAERTLLQATALDGDGLDRFSPDGAGTRSLLPLLELLVHQLQGSKASCLRRISCFQASRAHRSAEELKRRFAGRLERNVREVQQLYGAFRKHALRTAWHAGNIFTITELEACLAHTDHLVGTVRKNHLNCLRLLPSATQRNLLHIVGLSCARLKLTVHSLLTVSLVRLLDLLRTMDGEGSMRELHEKLQREIRQSLDEMRVNEEELASLRQKLFPTEVSLATQRLVAGEHRDLRAIDLQEQLRAIDSLEDDKQQLEGRVAELVERRESIQRKLDDRKRLLHDGVREIVRLEKLIEAIEQQMSDATVELQQQTETSEQRRLRALQDDRLSTEYRQRLLAECDAELVERRKSHASNMNLLEARRDELTHISCSLAKDVETFHDEIASKHRELIAELERRKLEATASELEVLEAEIQRQAAEYEENLSMLHRARERRESLTDDEERHSAADGQMGEVPSSAKIMQEDETGVFYVDRFGQKIYHRQYFTDPHGKYYIDGSGARIYAAAPSGSSAASTDQTIGTSAPEASEPAEAEADGAESVRDRRQRVAADVAYIEHALGVLLRQALAAVARAKPTDPVGYLSDYLALLSDNAMAAEKRQQLLERVRSADEKAGVSTPTDGI